MATGGVLGAVLVLFPERIVKLAVAGGIFVLCVAQAPQHDGSAALPGVGTSDRRHAVSLDAAPFRALARVQTELGARCTGFLIAPSLVMTAAHCLFLPRVGRYVQPASVHVLLGYRAGAYRAHARATGFRIAPGYRFEAEAATAGADRAVLVLDRPIGAASDVLALASVPQGDGPASLPVLLAGYGQDRDEIAALSPSCAITAVTRDGEGRSLLAHDCQATAGTSGAPLIRRCADGHSAAVGVQIEARRGDAGGLAAAALDRAARETAIAAPIPTGRCADR